MMKSIINYDLVLENFLAFQLFLILLLIMLKGSDLLMVEGISCWNWAVIG